MNCTPLARLADHAYERCLEAQPHPECERHNGTSPTIDECNACLRDWYFTTPRDDIGYDCPRRRWLYVIRYLPTTAYDAYTALAREGWWWNTIAPRMREEREVRVVSWGCGPGSDLIGAMVWLQHLRAYLWAGNDRGCAPTPVRLIGIDSQQGWRPIAEFATATAIPSYSPTAGFGAITCEWYPAKVASAAMLTFRPHILLCSWLWSEFEEADEAAALWQEISHALAELHEPCLAVFLDRTEERITRRLDKLVSLTKGDHRELVRSDAQEYRISIPFTPRTDMLLPRKNMKSSLRLLLLGTSQMPSRAET